MRVATVLLLTAGTLAAAPVPKELPKPDDAKALVGEWTVVSMNRHGEVVPKPDAHTFVFAEDGTFRTINQQDMSWDWTFALDPTATPKRMTCTVTAHGSKWDCLYDLAGATLKIGFLDAHAKPPATLEPGPKIIVYELKRGKAGK